MWLSILFITTPLEQMTVNHRLRVQHDLLHCMLDVETMICIHHFFIVSAAFNKSSVFVLCITATSTLDKFESLHALLSFLRHWAFAVIDLNMFFQCLKQKNILTKSEKYFDLLLQLSVHVIRRKYLMTYTSPVVQCSSRAVHCLSGETV
eukprot:gnl/MRDRNA2_/MRDRNA2_34244_c0_seq1.p1 gnl/MRDRNA2_/MRDRNA2_34244_c0~~gnl/MRDRNA2_/MRDRNA2_34244_c0_seq1.p1  ORF type:complete len:149 (-),score=5.49 gnl/MRDRNA2_/MRDRNA2_34244_c0_seq1:134-580(-)